jgi:hypothetical protein
MWGESMSKAAYWEDQRVSPPPPRGGPVRTLRQV